MSLYDEEVDETIDDIDEDSDIAEDIEPATRRLEEEQIELLNEIQVLVESVKESYADVPTAVEATVEGILNVIEGGGDGDGYLLIKRTETLEGVLPCTREVYESHMANFPETVPLDLSSGLLMMFEEINS